VSVAPAKGATFWDHLSLVVRRAFLSLISLAERSSPSRVRFAAPNNGAPLTAPGRSELTPPDKRERLIPEGCGHLGARGAKMAPFFTATDSSRPMRVTIPFAGAANLIVIALQASASRNASN
jgi:hypothetical protein